MQVYPVQYYLLSDLHCVLLLAEMLLLTGCSHIYPGAVFHSVLSTGVLCSICEVLSNGGLH